MQDDHRRGKPRRKIAVMMAAQGVVLSVVVAVSLASGKGGANPQTARTAQTAPAIPAKLNCAMLVQNGATRSTNVPDFQEIPGAPTRITSARIVAATDTQPEYCEVNGYVQAQVKFQLKLPTSTWQGRYLQFGCSGYCGTISRTSFPACRSVVGGDFAIAATNDGHDTSQVVDTLWAGNDEQARIDYGYRGAGGEGNPGGLLRASANAVILGGLLLRWARRADGSATLSAGLRRDHRGRPRKPPDIQPTLHGVGPACEH
jgi:hypothetical protein